MHRARKHESTIRIMFHTLPLNTFLRALRALCGENALELTELADDFTIDIK